MKLSTLDTILAARAAGSVVVLATRLPGGEQSLIVPDARGGLTQQGDFLAGHACLAEAERLSGIDRSGLFESIEGRVFLHVFTPPPRLIIVGAVHIAEPLTRMAESAGYSVVIIDPRRAFASRDRFRTVTMIADWPDEALNRLVPDRRTAVVTLTHDPKLDDAALRVALTSQAFYIGCLGSRKTHAARLSRLRAAGFDDAALQRIHGPVGLPIGALTPAEIAVAILAEITQVRRGPEDG